MSCYLLQQRSKLARNTYTPPYTYPTSATIRTTTPPTPPSINSTPLFSPDPEHVPIPNTKNIVTSLSTPMNPNRQAQSYQSRSLASSIYNGPQSNFPSHTPTEQYPQPYSKRTSQGFSHPGHGPNHHTNQQDMSDRPAGPARYFVNEFGMMIVDGDPEFGQPPHQHRSTPPNNSNHHNLDGLQTNQLIDAPNHLDGPSGLAFNGRGGAQTGWPSLAFNGPGGGQPGPPSLAYNNGCGGGQTGPPSLAFNGPETEHHTGGGQPGPPSLAHNGRGGGQTGTPRLTFNGRGGGQPGQPSLAHNGRGGGQTGAPRLAFNGRGGGQTQLAAAHHRLDGPPGLAYNGRGGDQTQLPNSAPTSDSPSGEVNSTANTNQDHAKRLKSKQREVNCLLKSLAKDRMPPVPDTTMDSSHDTNTVNSELQHARSHDNAARIGSGESDVENDGISNFEGGDDNGGDDDGGNNDGGNAGGDDDDCFAPVPEEVMEEIVGMDLDELRQYEALHAQNKRLPAFLKAELDDMYHEFEHNFTSSLSDTNCMLPFCPIDFFIQGRTLKIRCKEVAKVWATINQETKAKYKDPAYIETIRGDVPMIVVDGSIQTVRKTHVANTTLNLASNQKSVTFVKRWAKETINLMNEIAACHRIQAFLVIASGKSLGDIFITGGTRVGVSYLNMLVKSGDPICKFHTYAAGLAVIEELTNSSPEATSEEIISTTATQKESAAKLQRQTRTKTPGRRTSIHKLKANQQEAKKMLNDAGGKQFRGWPGKNALRDLGKAHIQLKIKKNSDNFIANEILQPIKAINLATSQRILRAIGEGWIRLKYQEDDEIASSPPENGSEEDERLAKRPKRNSKPNKQSKKSKSALDDQSEEEAVETSGSEEDSESELDLDDEE
ncbi:hypothetical protein H4Q26_000206 [Puccinia striiformis f. sp. tritici PST-130]|nr:hypothetical protein H4Q26_000206 [Puccinia striiformis f. sp. tritici PST-130]